MDDNLLWLPIWVWFKRGWVQAFFPIALSRKPIHLSLGKLIEYAVTARGLDVGRQICGTLWTRLCVCVLPFVGLEHSRFLPCRMTAFDLIANGVHTHVKESRSHFCRKGHC